MAAVAYGSSKRKLLDDTDSESESENGGASVGETKLKVNEEFARRFEHNKKREEIQRLEEKYKKDASKPPEKEDDDDSSSSDETEDEEGFLATEDLDAQISATLQAIRNKDPRVYDKNATFFKDDAKGGDALIKEKKEKPVYLRDYQREKIMRGDVGASDDEEDKAAPTYSQEQDALKRSIMSEINAARDSGDDGEDESDDEGFMKRKDPKPVDHNGIHPSRAPKVTVAELDITNADRDPETYLSNFMAARAWLPEGGGPRWEAFESDDGEDDGRADEFEQAYNMRFEDPEKSNEVLKSYARDVTAARSVRRAEKTARQRQRDLERERKDEKKRLKQEEKSRLKKLKLEETEDKLRKVRHAAGKIGKELKDEEWMAFLDDAWEDDKWEEEMSKRFGDAYYAEKEGLSDMSGNEDEEDGSGSKKRKRPKKPTWDDDIDIKDIVPDFDDESGKPNITLSDSEDPQEGAAEDAEEDEDEDEEESSRPSKKRKAADHKRARAESQKHARKERAKLEALVDAKMKLSHHDLLGSSSSAGARAGAASSSSSTAAAAPFRYRETSPQSFGLTSRDILLAPSDQALNEFAGLKKLATFRDEERKRRDRKRLGKKARLRQWRRDTFGREFENTGPTYGFERVAGDGDEEGGAKLLEDKSEPDTGEKKKKKRSRKSKAKKDAEGS